MDKNIVVLEYQNNFADNFSNLAYAKILEEKLGVSCVYENTTSKRNTFEKMMNDFDIKYSFVSKSHAESIVSKSAYMDYRDINSGKKTNKRVLNIPYFKIEDINKVNQEIIQSFNFKNTDFIINYDILDEILNSNSIGLYVSDSDISKQYINNALRRLNKYLKHPKLFIFSKFEFQLDEIVPYQFLKLSDFREEFYFLQNCKHKIIYCTKTSYSVGFWASVLSSKKGYTIYNKRMFKKAKQENWIGIN